MRFLVDEDLPRSTAELLRRHEHEATDVRDIGLGGATDMEIAAYAQGEGLCLVTGDLGFSNIRDYPPEKYAGLVVVRLPRTATASFILSLLEGFLQQEGLVGRMPGNLAIVEPGRVRIRSGRWPSS